MSSVDDVVVQLSDMKMSVHGELENHIYLSLIKFMDELHPTLNTEENLSVICLNIADSSQFELMRMEREMCKGQHMRVLKCLLLKR